MQNGSDLVALSNAGSPPGVPPYAGTGALLLGIRTCQAVREGLPYFQSPIVRNGRTTARSSWQSSLKTLALPDGLT